MYDIKFLNNELQEGTLIANFKTPENAIKALEEIALKWEMKFRRDLSLFGGYYVRNDGICYFIK